MINGTLVGDQTKNIYESALRLAREERDARLAKIAENAETLTQMAEDTEKIFRARITAAREAYDLARKAERVVAH